MPGGKVGGVGDVIRDLPAAVAALGWRSTVLMPSYGTLHRLQGAENLGTIAAEFRGTAHKVDVWRVPGNQVNVQNIVLDHKRLTPTEPGIIYHQDPDGGPFATDAEKFAFFGAAAAAWLDALRQAPIALHLHDWHTGVLATLRKFDTTLTSLRNAKTVFTIHNLSYQGQRPFAGTESSFENWFPRLAYDRSAIADPIEADCFNPMAASIRLADAVNTVSPSYKEEILLPSDAATGFIGGEGLEGDIVQANNQGRLAGILNGCDYDTPVATPLLWSELLDLCSETVAEWYAADASEVHKTALQNLQAMPEQRPMHLVTSVGRIVAQKMHLFLQTTESDVSALEEIVTELGNDGVMMILGSGETVYEEQIATIAKKHSNLIFLHGYSERLGEALYSCGDLFLMPSGFEPCGISQMIAMKNGQPCVVHSVGGLRDTIIDGKTGFAFDGSTMQEKAKNFVATSVHALNLRLRKPLQWEQIRKHARASRYEWRTSAQEYIRQLYEHH